MSDDISLVVGGNRSISGWTDIRITRGIERCPSDFVIGLTELFPGEAEAVVVQPGETCTVKIGGDPVITGYVDRYIPSIAAGSHSIHISGRGKCQDLVDCAAEWPNGQISGSSVLQIAMKLAEPYGIAVSGLPGVPIKQVNLNIGETSWEIIERFCRYSSMIAYELFDGSLFLTQAGTIRHASGFEQGKNVQAAQVQYSMDGRFSQYKAFAMSVSIFGELGESFNLLSEATDPGVTRHRMRAIISEQFDTGFDVAKKRATWEMNRRAARSKEIRITTDSWRDQSGSLWTPNTLAYVSLPQLKLDAKDYLIGEVTYKRDQQGTTADVMLMEPNAFLPQPIILYNIFRELSQQ